MSRSLIDILMGSFGEEVRTIHDLKSWPKEFVSLVGRVKRHEVRRCDRDYQVGDWLMLREWNPETKKYSGNKLFREITHITPAGAFGLPEDVCVLSVR